jgi:hypothetical protein
MNNNNFNPTSTTRAMFSVDGNDFTRKYHSANTLRAARRQTFRGNAPDRVESGKPEEFSDTLLLQSPYQQHGRLCHR